MCDCINEERLFRCSLTFSLGSVGKLKNITPKVPRVLRHDRPSILVPSWNTSSFSRSFHVDKEARSWANESPTSTLHRFSLKNGTVFSLFWVFCRQVILVSLFLACALLTRFIPCSSQCLSSFLTARSYTEDTSLVFGVVVSLVWVVTS